jgi:ribosomal protein S27E
MWAQSSTTAPATQTCVHCGRTMGDTAGGYATISGEPVCHPNGTSRPDCYHLATVYALTHPLYDCPRCTQPAQTHRVPARYLQGHRRNRGQDESHPG